MQNWIKSMLGSVALAGALAAPAHADLVLDLAPGGGLGPCGCSVGGRTIGWAFTVRDAIKIDGLGMWDGGSDAYLAQPYVLVGLWSSAGVLLASTAVTDASSPVASANPHGQWLFESIPVLTLAPGDYRIGAVYDWFAPLAEQFAPFTTIDGVTVTGAVSNADTGFDLMDPTSSYNRLIFGPTMRLADADADTRLPEPTSFALVGAALLGVGAASRRRRAR